MISRIRSALLSIQPSCYIPSHELPSTSLCLSTSCSSVVIVPLPMLRWQSPTLPSGFSSVTWLGAAFCPYPGLDSWLASCAIARCPCLEKPGLMFCCHCHYILNPFEKGALHFPFELGPTNDEAGPAATLKGWVRGCPLCGLTAPWLLLDDRNHHFS